MVNLGFVGSDLMGSRIIERLIAAEITLSIVMDSAILFSIKDGHGGILAGLSIGKMYMDRSTTTTKLASNLQGGAAVAGEDRGVKCPR